MLGVVKQKNEDLKSQHGFLNDFYCQTKVITKDQGRKYFQNKIKHILS